ncbi:hypothetical protein B0H14DRAFT_3142302 [Mycena olivaceomarginata]|nr:hypothetical protein B0H14DRAFT_3142302 [Mycena olivaceomarginata]
MHNNKNPTSSIHKETELRKRKTTSAERETVLLQDPCPVKLSPDELKGSPSELYCLCSPGRARKLNKAKNCNLKNWESHKKSCRHPYNFRFFPNKYKNTLFKYLHCAVLTHIQSLGIASFFSSTHKSNSPSKQGAQPVPIKKVIVADKQIRSCFAGSAQLWPTRIPPPIIVPEETECLGLHGEGYKEYAWQKGTSHLATRISHSIFPYKNWGGVSDSDTDTNSDASGAEAMPEKAVRAAANMTEPTHQQRIYMRGIKVETNTVVARRYWTDYERKRLQQSMELAARWSTQPNTGSVYARDCRVYSSRWGPGAATSGSKGSL